MKEVWNYNLVEEFENIRYFLPFSRFASFDTEFPGTIILPDVPKYCLAHLSPHVNYSFMKANVDNLKLIQLGLTLSSAPNPVTGVITSYVWQFNIKDFDVDHDPQNSDSIALLKKQGIDFAKNKVDGIDSGLLGSLLIQSGLLCPKYTHLTWVTFHGAYDFGFVVKILTRRPLPSDPILFIGLVRQIFRGVVFDIKHVMKSFSGLYGGLEKLANTLKVERKVEDKSHQAGPDSLLTMKVFYKLYTNYFNRLPHHQIIQFKNVIHGLDFPAYEYQCPLGIIVRSKEYQCPLGIIFLSRVPD